MTVITPYITVISPGTSRQNTQFGEIKKHPVRDAFKSLVCFWFKSLAGFDTCMIAFSTNNQRRTYMGKHPIPGTTAYFIEVSEVKFSTPTQRFRHNDTTNIKQFLNYQGVIGKISVVKSVVKPSEISLFSNVFTGGLGRGFNSYHPHIIFEALLPQGFFYLLC